MEIEYLSEANLQVLLVLGSSTKSMYSNAYDHHVCGCYSASIDKVKLAAQPRPQFTCLIS